ncbi:DEAD-BOX ATP-DEPENDENT RNA HELICASE 47 MITOCHONDRIAL [Salix koriyanagi]|uniref:RNA helicase n=1 Tax=Salix koriyanagi TaxID=2511006 RepID=A0A9Q0T048_9ROSI|nr:DEAD-BOX ATP-DEPENDENT RNA HELICASE 47 MITOCHONDRIAL [Salix koriyanagi]
MPSLVSPRLLFLVGEIIPLKKLSRGSSSALSQGSVRFFSRVDRHKNAPLTLANLGFNTEFEKTTKNKRNKLENVKVNYPTEAPKSREKVAASDKSRVVRVKKTLEIDSAPFAATSFSELGLPSPLIERLEMEGFNVPTDVQSAAIPTILKNHDAVIQSYTGSGKTLAYVLPILSKVGPLKG